MKMKYFFSIIVSHSIELINQKRKNIEFQFSSSLMLYKKDARCSNNSGIINIIGRISKENQMSSKRRKPKNLIQNWSFKWLCARILLLFHSVLSYTDVLLYKSDRAFFIWYRKSHTQPNNLRHCLNWYASTKFISNDQSQKAKKKKKKHIESSEKEQHTTLFRRWWNRWSNERERNEE